MSSDVLEELLQLSILSTSAVGGAIFRVAPELQQLTATIKRGEPSHLALAQQALAQKTPVQEQQGEYLHVITPISDDGLLGLVFKQESLTESQQQILKLIIRQAAQTIDLYRQMDTLQQAAERSAEQLEELEFIRQADRELTSQLDPERVVQFTLDWALRRTVADYGAVFIINPTPNKLTVLETIGFQKHLLENLIAQGMISPTKNIMGQAIQQRRATVIEDISTRPEFKTINDKAIAVLVVPLISQDRVIGALQLESTTPNRFDSDAVSFVERIAGMAAVALDNARLLEQAEQLADDMSLIQSGGRIIAASLEWETAIQRIGQALARAVKSNIALIYSYQPQNQHARLLSRYSVTDPTAANLPAVDSFWNLSSYALIQQAFQDNHLVVVTRTESATPETNWLQQIHGGAAAFIPLVAQGESIGLAVLIKTQPPYEYADNEIFVADSLGAHAASVLRQATLYVEVRELETIKSEMIRMASHDLRSPIANASGYLGLLEADVLDGRYDDLSMYVEAIRRSIGVMENLVRDLLTLEEIESQRNRPHDEIYLDALINEVFLEQETNAVFKQQQLTQKIEPGVYRCLGSRTHLRQAITNLIGNAIKYTPENGQIQIFLNPVPETQRLSFRVVDNGYGISADRQQRLFQRFYRAKEPGTEHISGTGLGLSLVKSIVERHGGTIIFESEPGKGSTFGFLLPVTLPDE